MGDDRLLSSGQTCWQIVRADAPASSMSVLQARQGGTMLRAHHPDDLLAGWDLTHGATSSEAPRPFRPQSARRLPLLDAAEAISCRMYVLKSNLRLLPAFDTYAFRLAQSRCSNQITASGCTCTDIDGARPNAPVITRRSWSSTMRLRIQWHRLPSTDGIPVHIRAMPVAAVGRWGAAIGGRHEVAAAVDGAAARALGEQLNHNRPMVRPVDAKHTTWPRRVREAELCATSTSAPHLA